MWEIIGWKHTDTTNYKQEHLGIENLYYYLMKIKLLLFGILSTLAKKQELDYTDIFSIKELKLKLFNQYPELKPYQFKTYINQQEANETHTLKEGDEIALIPPFAGG